MGFHEVFFEFLTLKSQIYHEISGFYPIFNCFISFLLKVSRFSSSNEKFYQFLSVFDFNEFFLRFLVNFIIYYFNSWGDIVKSIGKRIFHKFSNFSSFKVLLQGLRGSANFLLSNLKVSFLIFCN